MVPEYCGERYGFSYLKNNNNFDKSATKFSTNALACQKMRVGTMNQLPYLIYLGRELTFYLLIDTKKKFIHCIKTLTHQGFSGLSGIFCDNQWDVYYSITLISFELISL